MKITIEIELPIELSKDKKNFIVYSNAAFNQLVGTSAGASNAHIYGAKKSGKTWLLPVEEVKKRQKEILLKIDELTDKASFIYKVLKKVK